MVINELSYAKSENEFEVKLWYNTFFDLCQEIEKEYKIKVSLAYSKSLKESCFNDKIPFTRWISGQAQDVKRSILSMLTKSPFIHNYPSYKVYDEEGNGIGYAYENNFLLLSFITDSKWKNNFLSIIQEKFNEEDDEIESLKIPPIRNGYNSDSKQFHYKFIKNKIESLRKIEKLNLNGANFWERRIELFPNLIFCETIRRNISVLDGRNFGRVIDRLQIYDDYFSNWGDGDFDINIQGGASLESDSRLQIFKNELTINCPDGQNRIFSLHCRYGISGFRMHFFPDTATRKCIIGYIGKKIV